MKAILVIAVMLASLISGCVNSPFSPSITCSIYSRGSTLATATGDNDALTESSGGGEFQVEPTKP